jgi:hypothetical protein
VPLAVFAITLSATTMTTKVKEVLYHAAHVQGRTRPAIEARLATGRHAGQGAREKRPKSNNQLEPFGLSQNGYGHTRAHTHTHTHTEKSPPVSLGPARAN